MSRRSQAYARQRGWLYWYYRFEWEIGGLAVGLLIGGMLFVFTLLHIS